MNIKPMSRYMKTLSNERLAEFQSLRQKGKDGKVTIIPVSLFSREADAEAKRRRNKVSHRRQKA